MLRSIKFKIIAIIVLLFLSGMVGIALLLDASHRRNLALVSEQAIRTSESAFTNLETNDTARLGATMEVLLEAPELKKAFVDRDRERLFALADPLYRKLHDRYRVTHWYFHTPEPDAVTFLRVHKKAQFDDKVTRVTFQQAVQTKGFASGKELGATAFALRVVHPYYDGERLLGYMELGEEIDHFLDSMKQQSGDEFAMIVDKRFVARDGWDAVAKSKGEESSWDALPNVVLVATTTSDRHLLDFQGSVDDLAEGGKVLERVERDGAVYVRGIFPIYDAAKRKVGGVFVMHDISHIAAEQRAMQLRVLGLVGGLMLLICALLIWLVHRVVLRRLDKMIDTATAVVGGAYDREIVRSADDEIGRFESLFEQFRALFVNVLRDLELASGAKPAGQGEAPPTGDAAPGDRPAPEDDSGAPPA